MPSTIHVAVSVALEDAGEATRSLVLAQALRERCPTDRDIRISFLSCGSRFEPMVEKAGFPVVPCRPRLEGRSVADDLQWELPDLIGSARLGQELIEGQSAALTELRPDVVLHGFWPFASLAARMLGLPSIAFVALPLHGSCVTGGLVRDLPDPVPVLTRLPRPVRQKLARAGRRLMTRAPIFNQRRLGAAAAACGWPSKGPLSLFEAIHADLTVVTDLPAFHTGYPVPENFAIVGPVFPDYADKAPGDRGDQVDPDVSATLRRDGRPAVLLQMGSSGSRELLFEAIRALTPPRGAGAARAQDDWNVVVLAPPSVCRLDEARDVVGGAPGVLVTDRFITHPVAADALADVVVSHGGQGTVQSALAAGTPIVGVGLQLEQQINLDHVMDLGAGIRIQRGRWRAPVIREAVRTVLGTPTYRIRAERLAETIRAMDGPGAAAARMWEFLRRLPLRPDGNSVSDGASGT